MHIDQANLYNLKSLWHKYGSKVMENMPSQFINISWPYRCWHEDLSLPNNLFFLQGANNSTIYPLIPSVVNESADTEQYKRYEQQLEDNHWYCLFQQTAMFLPLIDDEGLNLLIPKPEKKLIIKRISSAQDITLWVDIVSQAFTYELDRKVIENLINDQDMQILLAFYHEQAVASAILYKTEDVVGVHQVGVAPRFQGKGLARSLMQILMSRSQAWQAKHIVLQASQVGKPLYESLGFISQFEIKNYQKLKS